MVLAVDFSGLDVWAKALASVLLIELCFLLMVLLALVVVLLLAARWTQMHVLPVLNTTVPLANQALEATNHGADRVVQGVAEVYGIRRGLETALQILLFGRVAPLPAPQARSQGVAPVTDAPPRAMQGIVAGARERHLLPSDDSQADAAARRAQPQQPQQPQRQQQPPPARAPRDRDVSGMEPHAG